MTLGQLHTLKVFVKLIWNFQKYLKWYGVGFSKKRDKFWYLRKKLNFISMILINIEIYL